MVVASLWFANLDWGIPALAAALLSAALIAWSYRMGPPGPIRLLCAACKGLGIAALLICLLEPMWTRERPRPGANFFAVVADNSQGMQVHDAGALTTRGESLQAVLRGDHGPWQESLADSFEVRGFTFDARLQDARGAFDLSFDGRASEIGGALRSIGERFQGRPLAGIILLTDGIATDRDVVADSLDGLPPVYPVVIGRDAPVRDIAVGQVRVNRTAFEDAPITIQTDVSARGLHRDSIFARIEDADGRIIQQQTQSVRNDEQPISFRFQLRPDQPGLTFYRLRTGLTDEPTADDPAGSEATLLNNHRVVAVDQGRGPYRVLYVSGRPNWEYKFLNRALQADDQVNLVALIRIALREPKFEFRGRAGETSNPLFRGFGDQSREEAERYDQPVLTRLNTRDEIELRGGFPRTAEELYEYHAVILDDVEAGFFDADQALLLQHFVSRRGGGMLMLGGMETFQQGGYRQSPIGDMLPVYLDRTPPKPVSGPVAFGLAREGWLEPWARLRDNEADERRRLEQMPRFQVLNPVRDVKPGASVVAHAADEDGEVYPALVTQRFGRGRTGAVMLGDLWRWGMQDPQSRADMDKTWRQLVRWMVSDVPHRVELAAEDASAAGPGAMRLRVRARDESFQPLDDASIHLHVTPVMADESSITGGVVRLQPVPAMADPGLFEAEFAPRYTGGYRADVVVTNAAGEEVGRAETGWSVDLAAEEFRSLRPDPALLEDIARRTGGEVTTPDRIEALARSLPSRAAPIMESWTKPLWHTPLVFLFALACFATEWGLRRWRGLP